MQVERRKARRVPLSVKVEIAWGATRLQAHTADLSWSGMFVQTPAKLETGAAVLVRFTLWLRGGPAQVEVEALVVRRQSPAAGLGPGGPLPGLGLRFERFRQGETQLRERLAPELAARRDARWRAPELPEGLPVAWSVRPPVQRPGWLLDATAQGLELRAEEWVEAGSRLYLCCELPVNGERFPVRMVGQVGRVRELAEGARWQGSVVMELALENASVDTQVLARWVHQALRPELAGLTPGVRAPTVAERLLERSAAPGRVGRPEAVLERLDRSIEAVVHELMRASAPRIAGEPDADPGAGQVPALRRLAENRIAPGAGPLRAGRRRREDDR